ncbi:MAG TPA: tetratricopeptide repeat protein [Azospirillaceae bacterium]|nr:tetratricopeptide repeat protein [Azospirillaceae bacterium]
MSHVMRAALLLAVTLSVAACASTREDIGAGAGGAVPAGVRERAEAALAMGAYEDALTQYRIILSRDPEDPMARLGIAEVQLGSGDLKQAEAGFGALKEVAAVRAKALQGEGLALLLAGRTKTAEEPLRAAVAEDAGLWRAWNALGRIHDGRGEFDAAKPCYEQALASQPNSPVVLNNLGFSRLMAGDHAEAARLLTQAAESDDGEEARVRTNLRLALAWQGEYVAAFAGARPAELPVVLNNVGFVALQRGDVAAAKAYLSRATEISPEYFDVARRNLDQARWVEENKVLADGAKPGKRS